MTRYRVYVEREHEDTSYEILVAVVGSKKTAEAIVDAILVLPEYTTAGWEPVKEIRP